MNWHLFNEPPQPGTRFVALYSDGSGASVYRYDDEKHLIDATGEDICGQPVTSQEIEGWMFDAGYLHWAVFPEGQRLFFEEVEEVLWRFLEGVTI